MLIPSYFFQEEDESLDFRLIPTFFFEEKDDSAVVHSHEEEDESVDCRLIPPFFSEEEDACRLIPQFFFEEKDDSTVVDSREPHLFPNWSVFMNFYKTPIGKEILNSYKPLIGECSSITINSSRSIFDSGKAFKHVKSFSEFVGEFCFDTYCVIVLRGFDFT